MIKTILVVAIFACLGGGIMYFFSGQILSAISAGTAYITDLTGQIPNITEQIPKFISYVQENWQIVAGSIGSVTLIGGTITNWLYSRARQKQQAETEIKVAEAQTVAITEQNKSLNLEIANKELTKKIALLEEGQKDVATLVNQVQSLETERDKLLEQRNQLAALVPDKQTFDEWNAKLEKATKVH